MADVARRKARAKLAAVGGERLAEDVETCVFNFTLRVCREAGVPLYWENRKVRDVYAHKIWSMIFNLKNPANPGLLRRVQSGEMPIKTLVDAHPAVLFPEKWDELYEIVAKKQLRKQLTTDIDKVPEGAFTCSRCKSRKTVFYEMQTRSADEPSTIFIQCIACSKRWKQ